MKTLIFIFALPLVLLQYSCLTPEQVEPTVITVPAKTIVSVPTKSDFSHEEAAQPPKKVKTEIEQPIRFEVAVLDARKIVRPRVEIREGPGAAYFIEDTILEKGELVVVLEKYFRWRKVLAVEKKVEGWVHEKTLSQDNVTKGTPQISLNHFPSIFPRVNLKRVFDYRTNKKIPYEIPRGKNLRKLRQDKNRVLIFIEETHSVAWLREGDVI